MLQLPLSARSLRRTLTLTLTFIPSPRPRLFTTTSILRVPTAPMPTALDTKLFNQGLVASIQKAWYQDLPHTARVTDEATRARWYGVGKTPAEKAELDDFLRDSFGSALAALNSTNYPLPAPSEADRTPSGARALLQPLLSCAPLWEGSGGAECKNEDTALALVLLLDQFSRNVFRDPNGQGEVYGHYDRLSRALARSCIEGGAEGSPDLRGLHNAGANHLNPTRITWFLMPFMHSEDLRDHAILKREAAQYKKALEDEGDQEAADIFGLALKFEEEHRVILEQFGRYPHRNKPMGRSMREEERKYLEDGGETFGN